MKGRKAIGAIATLSAVGLFLSDNITGNGSMIDRSRRLRRDAELET